MAKKKRRNNNVSFFLNNEQLDKCDLVLKTLKSAGQVVAEVSLPQMAKATFVTFIEEMLEEGGKKEDG